MTLPEPQPGDRVRHATVPHLMTVSHVVQGEALCVYLVAGELRRARLPADELAPMPAATA